MKFKGYSQIKIVDDSHISGYPGWEILDLAQVQEAVPVIEMLPSGNGIGRLETARYVIVEKIKFVIGLPENDVIHRLNEENKNLASDLIELREQIKILTVQTENQYKLLNVKDVKILDLEDRVQSTNTEYWKVKNDITEANKQLEKLKFAIGYIQFDKIIGKP